MVTKYSDLTFIWL